MLTKNEYDLLKHQLVQHLIEISNQCLMFRARDVINILENFTKENDDGREQEGETKAELLEKRVEQESSGEDRTVESGTGAV